MGKKKEQGDSSHLLSATQPISSMERRFTRETSEDIPGLGRILILCNGLQPQPGRLRVRRTLSVSPALSAPVDAQMQRGEHLERGRRAADIAEGGGRRTEPGEAAGSQESDCCARSLQGGPAALRLDATKGLVSSITKRTAGGTSPACSSLPASAANGEFPCTHSHKGRERHKKEKRNQEAPTVQSPCLKFNTRQLLSPPQHGRKAALAEQHTSNEV